MLLLAVLAMVAEMLAACSSNVASWLRYPASTGSATTSELSPFNMSKGSVYGLGAVSAPPMPPNRLRHVSNADAPISSAGALLYFKIYLADLVQRNPFKPSSIAAIPTAILHANTGGSLNDRPHDIHAVNVTKDPTDTIHLRPPEAAYKARHSSRKFLSSKVAFAVLSDAVRLSLASC